MSKITSGIVGGLAGGVIFGVIMSMMGMMPMIAMMVGSKSVALGWIVHLIISAITGIIFAITFDKCVTSMKKTIGSGVAYGVIWWVLGPLMIMPLILGMGLQFGSMFDPMKLNSLMGHIIFGVVLAVVYNKTQQGGASV